MDSAELNKPGIGNQAKETIPPLPFTYERTLDPKQTAFVERRASRKGHKRTDEEILGMVRKEKEGQEWFMSKYWRNKGMPSEQVEFTINGRQITVYNYAKEKPFTDEHIQRAQKVFEEFSSHFPQILERVRWVLVDDYQLPTALGDPEKYPTMGEVMKKWRSFRLFPIGMRLSPFRIPTVTNFEGVLTHELTHLIEGEFEDEWQEKFQWDFCINHEADWEWKPTPGPTFDGSNQRPYNKKTGEMAPNGKFPLQSDKCITYRARIDWTEDVCESVVAYIHDPEMLKRIVPEKYEIIQRHDTGQAKPTSSAQRVPQDQIKLPEIQPEMVRYYIKERPDERVFKALEVSTDDTQEQV